MPMTSVSAIPSGERLRRAHLRPPMEVLSELFFATAMSGASGRADVARDTSL